MEIIFKLLIFLVFFISILITGYKGYFIINNKITGSKNGWELIGFSLLLLFFYTLLFFGGLLAFIKAYDFLMDNQ
jgi:hypothetical protein